MLNPFKIFSWLSIITFISYVLLLITELFNGFLLSEIDVIPIIFGIILLVNFAISVSIIRKKLKPNITVLIIQILIIIFCLYLIYYFNFGAVKVD
jgi:amino acid permease